MSNSVREPLRADIGSGTDVVNAAGEIIATCCSKDVASRIVASVNSCAGVSTTDLDRWVKGKYDKNGFGYIGRLVLLTTHRDKLLEALEYHQEQTRPIQRTIDAIASVKGGAA